MLDPKIARRFAPGLLSDVVAHFEGLGRVAPFTLTPWDVARALDLTTRKTRDTEDRQSTWMTARRLMVLMAQNPGPNYIVTPKREPFGIHIQRAPTAPRANPLSAAVIIPPEMEFST